jgi:hypothetical protein
MVDGGWRYFYIIHYFFNQLVLDVAIVWGGPLVARFFRVGTPD